MFCLSTYGVGGPTEDSIDFDNQVSNTGKNI